MYEMDEIGTAGPAIGGPLTVWHAHDHVCFALTPHLDECESAGESRLTIRHDVDVGDLSELAERVRQLVFGGRESGCPRTVWSAAKFESSVEQAPVSSAPSS